MAPGKENVQKQNKKKDGVDVNKKTSSSDNLNKKEELSVKPTLPIWLLDANEGKDFCKQTFEDAHTIVKETFEKVKYINEKEVVAPELEGFLSFVNGFKNPHKAQARMYKTADGSKAKDVPIRNNLLVPISANRQYKTVKVVDKRKNAQSVNGLIVPTQKGRLPLTRFFTHTERNILTRNTLRLSHIPYIDDNTVDDVAFMKELLSAYTEGIHGTSQGRGEHINEFMMWKLLEMLHEKFDAENRRYICGAIFEMFPNKYSFKELMCDDTLTTLRERFTTVTVDDSDWKGDARIGGVTSLLCSKCLVYNCMTHPDVQDDLALKPSSMAVAHNPQSCTTACKNQCFLLAENNENLSPPKLESSFLEDFFKARVSDDAFDMCQLTEQMNMMCKSLRVPELECQQWHSLMKSFLDEPSTSNVTSKKHKKEKKDDLTIRRERYKIFNNSMKKRGMNAIDNSVELRPCNHPGKKCEDEQCECYARGGVCTKYCQCEDCPIMFPGCTCSPGQCGGSTCACVLANWECDPDTCVACNCDATSTDVGTDNCASKPLCRNINLQLGLQKKLQVGVSAVSGNGCFLIGTAKPGDLISEYTGELISQDETDRRGIIYDKYGCSYIFQLNRIHSIDAGKMGNLIRFANNDSVNPNCVARTVVVNGEQRVAVYARKDIQNNEELFFDYNYTERHRSEYVAVSRHGKKKEVKNKRKSVATAVKAQ